ncbi:MAG TPA: hypothetical protein VNE58_18355 [Casimicrobiaceae bacterium]|nr:hypothetical protein [Casimicrobiaceae bacterium]
MNGLTLLALIALAIGLPIAYRLGSLRERRHARASTTPSLPPSQVPTHGDVTSLNRDLEAARADVARYRQIVVDIENRAPPPLLNATEAPDDLKLIVGIGPVLERMLYQLGIGSYRQIARWTEQDIDAIDARLPEFPGRIRRDAWVTQAREMHMAKYGEPP